jgi:hypothetical protein
MPSKLWSFFLPNGLCAEPLLAASFMTTSMSCDMFFPVVTGP